MTKVRHRHRGNLREVVSYQKELMSEVEDIKKQFLTRAEIKRTEVTAKRRHEQNKERQELMDRRERLKEIEQFLKWKVRTTLEGVRDALKEQGIRCGLQSGEIKDDVLSESFHTHFTLHVRLNHKKGEFHGEHCFAVNGDADTGRVKLNGIYPDSSEVDLTDSGADMFRAQLNKFYDIVMERSENFES